VEKDCTDAHVQSIAKSSYSHDDLHSGTNGDYLEGQELQFDANGINSVPECVSEEVSLEELQSAQINAFQLRLF